MIHLVSLLVLARSGGSDFKAHELFFATEDRLKQVVGRRTSPPKEPGIRFAHPGYYEVWIDSPGTSMKHLRMGLGSLVGWKQYLSNLGLGVARASTRPVAVAGSPIPLYRNKLSVSWGDRPDARRGSQVMERRICGVRGCQQGST